jgi:hypothetical protein
VDAFDSLPRGCYRTRDVALLPRLYLSKAAISFSTAFSSRPSSDVFFSTPKSVDARGGKSRQRGSSPAGRALEVRDDRAGRAVEGVSRRGREARDRARTPRVRRVRFDVESGVRDVP